MQFSMYGQCLHTEKRITYQFKYSSLMVKNYNWITFNLFYTSAWMIMQQLFLILVEALIQTTNTCWFSKPDLFAKTFSFGHFEKANSNSFNGFDLGNGEVSYV